MKKTAAQPVSKSKSTSEPNQSIRILYSGTCPKLTNRGKGDLSYELGIDDTGESHVRISANASSGAFSNEYVDFTRIKLLLDHTAKQPKPFSSIVLESLFTGRSSNNYGYLAAVLIAEKVLTVLPGKPVMLTLGTWDTIQQKIQVLKEQGVSLTDHIAIANIQKAERRAELVAKMRIAKTAKTVKPPEEEKS